MITIEERQFETPIGIVYRSILTSKGIQIIAYECTGGSVDSIAGLILEVESFRKSAMDAINTHLREDTP